ncbi:DUF2835 family protein [Parashewanella spongiae]|uniref:DUF2835 family protein n=1 Tax=Parashewanella spongiae TaxID=342950 RepID=A0A3A6TZE9_9GAMM|nr:DUF2835 domain-containing protein [Parashewanella spongiae]MCL1078486.1 DUF2835 domain-containing protein [Parashewanella spongiae]RJY14669.1 DUF2835 family protein [Parashewanella spongiae]
MEFYFSLSITSQEFLRFYKGNADRVEVIDVHGRCLHIHARHFLPFLSESGIRGQFQLTLDNQNNFKSLKPI